MQKRLVIFVVLLGLLVPAFLSAQTWGFNVGFNSSSFSGDDADDFDGSKAGFLLGGLAIVPLTNNIGVRIEANFTNKGASVEDVYYYDDKLEMTFSYLEIPVMAQYQFQTGGSIAPVFFGGPAIAFKMSAKSKYMLGSDSDTETTEDVKAMDMGIMMGGGIRIMGKFFVTIRYTMGLMNWFDGVGIDLKHKTISAVASMTL